MKRFTTLIAFALLAGAALAGITTTPKDGDYVLHNADNSIPAGFTKDTARFKSKELCAAAVDAGAKAGTLKPGVKCDTSIGFTFAQDCEGEKPPKLYLSKVVIDGQEYLDLPGASFTEDTYVEMAELYVHAPTWPANYPNCWVRGEVPRSEWRMNSKDEPGKAFMEHLEPGMDPADQVADVPNSIEPMPTPAGFDEEWHSPEREAERHAKCDCYADDKTPCPPIPGPNCPAMVPPA